MNIKIKNKLPIALALLLATSPLVAYAETETVEVMPISDQLNTDMPVNTEAIPIMAEEEIPNYLDFNGKIANLKLKEEKSTTISNLITAFTHQPTPNMNMFVSKLEERIELKLGLSFK